MAAVVSEFQQAVATAVVGEAPPDVLSGVKGKTWSADKPVDTQRDGDGSFSHEWHWNTPYTYKRNLPDW